MRKLPAAGRRCLPRGLAGVAFLLSGVLGVLALLLLVPSTSGWLIRPPAGRVAVGTDTLGGLAPASALPRQPTGPVASTASGQSGQAGMAPGARRLTPTRLRVPSLGIDAPVGSLGLTDAGALQVPRDFSATGWWSGGAVPGEQGPSVVVGHVDSYHGPAVFYRLRDLRDGAAIFVQRSDGSTAVFVAERRLQVAKNDFPTEQVYGATAAPALRLITCSGSFNRDTRHYRDNLVVFARFVGVREPAPQGGR